jgi:hypothetical protein
MLRHHHFYILVVVYISFFIHIHALNLQSNLQMTSLKKGVLFDVDGTISDSWFLGYSCTQKVLEEFGHRSITGITVSI